MHVVDELISGRFKFTVATVCSSPLVVYRSKTDPSDATFIAELAKHRYVRPDNEQFYPGIPIDVDRPDAVTHIRRRCAELNLPLPEMIENPTNGHAQAMWWLNKHVQKLSSGVGMFGKKNGNSAFNWLRDTQVALSVAFGADTDHRLGSLIRNRFYKDHIVHEGDPNGHSLDEFTHICRRFLPERVFISDIDPDRLVECASREATMYQTLRRWAYSYARRHQWMSYEEWVELLTVQAMAIYPQIASRPAANTRKPHKFTWGQAMISVRSIARYMANTYEYYLSRPMNLDRTLDATERMRMGQAYSAKQTRGRNINKVWDARKANPGATQKQIAEITGLSLRTVKSHWHQPRQDHVVESVRKVCRSLSIRSHRRAIYDRGRIAPSELVLSWVADREAAFKAIKDALRRQKEEEAPKPPIQTPIQPIVKPKKAKKRFSDLPQRLQIAIHNRRNERLEAERNRKTMAKLITEAGGLDRFYDD
jgi:replicase family protein